MDETKHLGRPQLNVINNAGERGWQRPVYATAAEARVSSSGWLYWVDDDLPERRANRTDGGV